MILDESVLIHKSSKKVEDLIQTMSQKIMDAIMVEFKRITTNLENISKQKNPEKDAELKSAKYIELARKFLSESQKITITSITDTPLAVLKEIRKSSLDILKKFYTLFEQNIELLEDEMKDGWNNLLKCLNLKVYQEAEDCCVYLEKTLEVIDVSAEEKIKDLRTQILSDFIKLYNDYSEILSVNSADMAHSLNLKGLGYETFRVLNRLDSIWERLLFSSLKEDLLNSIKESRPKERRRLIEVIDQKSVEVLKKAVVKAKSEPDVALDEIITLEEELKKFKIFR